MSDCLKISENFWWSTILTGWWSESPTKSGGLLIWVSDDLTVWKFLKTSDIRYFQTLRSSDVQIVSLSVFLSTSDLCVWYQNFSDVQTFSDVQNFCQVADVSTPQHLILKSVTRYMSKPNISSWPDPPKNSPRRISAHTWSSRKLVHYHLQSASPTPCSQSIQYSMYPSSNLRHWTTSWISCNPLHLQSKLTALNLNSRSLRSSIPN